MLEKIKKSFRSTTSRNGSYSLGLIALVIGIVIVINLIAGQLPENIRNIDISDNKIYEITDTSKKILEKLDEEITFTIYAEKDSTDERIKSFVKKYAALSSKIKVEWVDPVQHPAELTENNVSSDTILVSCEKTGKSKAVAFSSILVTDEYSYYMTGSTSESQFDGEGQLTSAINYVTSDVSKTIYCTTGHGENTFSSSVSALLDKNNIISGELNLIMENEIPDDCDLLFMNAPSKDITEDEKTLILSYLSSGGDVFIILGESEDDTPNLDAVLKEYGMQRTEGYIADMQRCYQGNYYYIFPEISAYGELAEGLESQMVLLINAHGMTLTDPARDTIATTEFMSTSENAYSVTEDTQEQGSYVLGAVATETISNSSENESEDSDSGDTSEEGMDKSRLTVVSTGSLIDSQVTDSFSTLENLDLFMNAVTANFEDVDNVAIEPKSLEVTYNSMQHAGLLSILVIFVIPLIILLFGFVKWWKRRKA
ncbi:MAG: GldG family protein [Dorea sp.]|nr:GldG family protein [Dorea sp.]